MKNTIDCAGSSNLSEITYDNHSMVLEVTYKDGSVYTYADVPDYKITELQGATSKGSYLHTNIKNDHPSTKVK